MCSRRYIDNHGRALFYASPELHVHGRDCSPDFNLLLTTLSKLKCNTFYLDLHMPSRIVLLPSLPRRRLLPERVSVRHRSRMHWLAVNYFDVKHSYWDTLSTSQTNRQRDTIERPCVSNFRCLYRLGLSDGLLRM